MVSQRWWLGCKGPVIRISWHQFITLLEANSFIMYVNTSVQGPTFLPRCFCKLSTKDTKPKRIVGCMFPINLPKGLKFKKIFLCSLQREREAVNNTIESLCSPSRREQALRSHVTKRKALCSLPSPWSTMCAWCGIVPLFCVSNPSLMIYAFELAFVWRLDVSSIHSCPRSGVWCVGAARGSGRCVTDWK